MAPCRCALIVSSRRSGPKGLRSTPQAADPVDSGGAIAVLVRGLAEPVDGLGGGAISRTTSTGEPTASRTEGLGEGHQSLDEGDGCGATRPTSTAQEPDDQMNTPYGDRSQPPETRHRPRPQAASRPPQPPGQHNHQDNCHENSRNNHHANCRQLQRAHISSARDPVAGAPRSVLRGRSQPRRSQPPGRATLRRRPVP